MPRVVVVTPTFERHDVLLRRCLPSVRAQTYRDYEHVVVSDGPDPWLANVFGSATLWPQTRFTPLESHQGGLGAAARNHGVDQSSAPLVAFLDDDNAYRPLHLEVLVAALDAHPEVGFAYGKLFYPETQSVLPPAHPPVMNHIDGSMFVARRELFELARWEWDGRYALDWLLIERWLAAGVQSAFVDEITIDYWWARR